MPHTTGQRVNIFQFGHLIATGTIAATGRDEFDDFVVLTGGFESYVTLSNHRIEHADA